MSSPHRFLTIDAEHQSAAYVIRILGELDFSGCPDLGRALEAAEQTQADRIIVELEALTFIKLDRPPDPGAGKSSIGAQRKPPTANSRQGTPGQCSG